MPSETVGRVESVNTGRAREVTWHGTRFRTGIFKSPVEGPVRVEGVSVQGDEQADLSVHGGPTKSVYAYPSEHYEAWRTELDGAQAEVLDTPGAFGENLTISGLLESEVGVGDRFRVGTALLVATEPRMPCSKLGMRFDDPGMVKRFHRAGRNGIYFSIAEPGEIRAGDPIRREEAHPVRLTIAEVVDLYTGRLDDAELRAVAASHPALPEGWRRTFGE